MLDASLLDFQDDPWYISLLQKKTEITVAVEEPVAALFEKHLRNGVFGDDSYDYSLVRRYLEYYSAWRVTEDHEIFYKRLGAHEEVWIAAAEIISKENTQLAREIFMRGARWGYVVFVLLFCNLHLVVLVALNI